MEPKATEWNKKIKQAILDADFSLFEQLLQDRATWIDSLAKQEKIEVLPIFIAADIEVKVLVEGKMNELKDLLIHQNNQRKVFNKYDKY